MMNATVKGQQKLERVSSVMASYPYHDRICMLPTTAPPLPPVERERDLHDGRDQFEHDEHDDRRFQARRAVGVDDVGQGLRGVADDLKLASSTPARSLSSYSSTSRA